MNNYSNNVATPTEPSIRQPDVKAQMGALADGVDRLIDTVTTLSERLSPVIRPALPTNQANPSVKEVISTPLASDLNDIKNRVAQVFEIADSLLRRLEL